MNRRRLGSQGLEVSAEGLGCMGMTWAYGTGDEQSVSASVGIQYLLTETWTTYARYSYFNQVSSTPGVGYYQNLVLVGVTKTF